MLAGVGAEATVVLQLNTGSNIEVAKLQMFNGKTGKVLDFLTACRFYIKMRMRKTTIEEQIQ